MNTLAAFLWLAVSIAVFFVPDLHKGYQTTKKSRKDDFEIPVVKARVI